VSGSRRNMEQPASTRCGSFRRHLQSSRALRSSSGAWGRRWRTYVVDVNSRIRGDERRMREYPVGMITMLVPKYAGAVSSETACGRRLRSGAAKRQDRTHAPSSVPGPNARRDAGISRTCCASGSACPRHKREACLYTGPKKLAGQGTDTSAGSPRLASI
jgi:hypothetical protein